MYSFIVDSRAGLKHQPEVSYGPMLGKWEDFTLAISNHDTGVHISLSGRVLHHSGGDGAPK